MAKEEIKELLNESTKTIVSIHDDLTSTIKNRFSDFKKNTMDKI